MPENDIPSPIDFHEPTQAKEWEAQTIKNKPWRPKFFAAFVSALNGYFPRAFSILELGSGPGHLAEQILTQCNISRYVALDFSKPMHGLARARLGALTNKVEFLERDFRSPNWAQHLGQLDAVVTMQAAHEVRHTRHLPAFLTRARQCLAADGLFLYCDHYAEANSSKNPDLYLSPTDQVIALEQAGFSKIEKLLDVGGMALFATISSG